MTKENESSCTGMGHTCPRTKLGDRTALEFGVGLGSVSRCLFSFKFFFASKFVFRTDTEAVT